MEDRQLKVLMRLLGHYESTIHSSDVNFLLKSHPDFGTLKGTSETLEGLGVINTPVRIERNEFDHMDFPFLGYIQENGNQNLIIIESCNSDSVTYYEEQLVVEEKNSFLNRFTGISIILEMPKEPIAIQDKVQQKDRRIWRAITGAIGLSVVLSFFLFSIFPVGSSLRDYVPLFIKLAGVFITSFLLLKEFRTNLGNAFCKIGAQVDCDAVIQSKSAFVFSWVKWTDVGFVYFAASFLGLLYNPSLVSLLSLVSILAVPYVFWSLYQQAIQIKKWCTLCLLTLAVLMIDFGFTLVNATSLNFKTQHVIELLLVFGATSSVHLIIRYAERLRKLFTNQRINYERIKNTPDVFLSSLKRGEKVKTIASNKNLVFGNKNPDAVKITAFLSLKCEHCAQSFHELNALMNGHEEFAVHLIPAMSGKNMKELAFLLKLHSIYTLEGKKEALQLLSDWYQGKLKSDNDDINTEQLNQEERLFLQVQGQHVLQNRIANYPALFVQEHRVSPHYSLQDYGRLKSNLNLLNEESDTKENDHLIHSTSTP